jgi:5-methyltetrahydrofolate--homocysteine methyltransferase
LDLLFLCLGAQRIIDERRLTLRAVFGFWPAASEDEDIVLFEPGEISAGAGAAELMRFTMLRQQDVQAAGRPNRSLADFIAPRDSGRLDHLGAFAVTAGLGADQLASEYEQDHDDYHAIMVKALADRLAEATAEYLHKEARGAWVYGRDEQLSKEELQRERYRGIRPAFGYPACPDHSEKFKLFDLLQARSLGLDLTESAAMTPAASVSGLYFAHPQASYFTVGRIGADQVEQYARRKGWAIPQVERWLGPSLAYEATDLPA